MIVFPASNDDRDLLGALERLGARAEPVWHRDTRLPEATAGIGIPGGFSYGDYLRAGAMARFSPIMPVIGEHALAGRPILGICNGFQILCESGLLPGALVRNESLRFQCEDVDLRAGETGAFDLGPATGRTLSIPMKHGEGAYVPDPSHAARVAFRYHGRNPNGSVDWVAGVVIVRGNVLGLMPHPEHAVDPLLGSTDGVPLLRAFLEACLAQEPA